MPLLTAGRLRTKDPGLHQAQGMELFGQSQPQRLVPEVDVPRARVYGLRRAVPGQVPGLLCGCGPVLFLPSSSASVLI